MSGPFPEAPEEVTPDFLERALGAPAGALRGVAHEPVGTGQVCDSYRFRLEWRDGGERPASVVAKLPSRDPTSRQAAAIFHLYEVETGWYRDIANGSGVACPHAWHARVADDGLRFALILEDMAPAEQGDQLAGGSVEQVDAALTELAALHAWAPPAGRALEDYAWLRHGEANKAFVRANLPASYPAFRERFAGLLNADVLDLGQRLADGFDAYLDRQPTERSIAHSDARVDNILFGRGEDGAIAATLVDWQTAQIGTGAADVAYLIGTSFADADERRREEGALIARYLTERERRGRAPDEAAFREDLRHASLAGFVMAVNAALHVERTDRGDAMFAAMAARPAAMALDWDWPG